jgi:hypothetical protein
MPNLRDFTEKFIVATQNGLLLGRAKKIEVPEELWDDDTPASPRRLATPPPSGSTGLPLKE